MQLRRMMSWLAVGLFLLVAPFARAQDPGQQVEKDLGLDSDLATNLRVELIGRRIAYAADISGISYYVIKDRELNAFALPDGRIFVTSLMARVVTDDELAYVLGHEITHIKRHHAKNQMERATGGAVLGAILAAVLGGGEQEVRMGADIASGLTYGHYSRKDETTADREGVLYMTRAGYDPRKAADAMQRLIDRYGSGDASIPILGWFASHPDSRDRKTRLLNEAERLKANPPDPLPAAQGVELKYDPSAVHVQEWLPPYLGMCVLAFSEGHGQLLMPSPYTTPAQAGTAVLELKDDKDKKKKPDVQQAVTVNIPQLPPAYRVTVSLRQVPPEGAASLDAAKGTAVEATLQWTELAHGFSGTITAYAQTTRQVPWQAREQVGTPADLRLDDGKTRNLEGTLEATAVRRAAKALGEILEAGGPVDHSAPVTVKLAEGSARRNNYVVFVRKDRVIGEMLVEQVNGRNVTGSVLWGSHTLRKSDKVVPAPEL